MLQPDIVFPETIEEAIQALQARGAVVLGGATDLIPAMQRGEVRPRLLVNLKHIAGLAGIRRVRGGTRVGAATRVADLLHSALIASHFPLLIEVAHGFASPQIRNLATIGGNLCNAAPSADFALPLLVLDARAEIHGRSGSRELDLASLFKGVNTTALRRGEILTAIHVPRMRLHTGAAYVKLGVRRSMDLALASAAAALTLAPDRKTCRQARIALGAVAPIPKRTTTAEAVLEGKRLSPDLFAQAAAKAAADSHPISDLRASAGYRRQMVRVLVTRVLREALVRARKEPSR